MQAGNIINVRIRNEKDNPSIEKLYRKFIKGSQDRSKKIRLFTEAIL